jgi:DNA-binding transcriptional MerR regulator
MKQELFTRTQVSQMFGISYFTVIDWEKRGLLKPDCHIRKRPYYSKEQLENLKANKK